METKSQVVGALCVLFFGPFGVMYSSILAGLLFWLPLSIVGIVLFPTGVLVWVLMFVDQWLRIRSQNKRILESREAKADQRHKETLAALAQANNTAREAAAQTRNDQTKEVTQ